MPPDRVGKTLDSIPDSIRGDCGSTKPVPVDCSSAWQQAQERVIRYLNALKIDPIEGTAIAHQALQAATTSSSLSPATASMRALRRILADRQSRPDSPQLEMLRLCRHLPENTNLMMRVVIDDPEAGAADPPAQAGPMWPIMPGLQRGAMRSENVCGASPLKFLWRMLFHRSGDQRRAIRRRRPRS